jgi:hypothetical protein
MKLSEKIDVKNELELMLSLFRAKTEEDVNKLEILEVPVVTQAIEAYRAVTVSDEFKELERLRDLARHNEASALENARRKEREKLQGVIAGKDAEIASKDAEIASKDAEIASNAAALVDKDAEIASNAAALVDKDAEIARLRALLGESK